MNPTLSDPVVVALDRERTLRYDFRAHREIQRTTGRRILGDGYSGDDFEDVEFFLECLRAGLLHEDPTITVEQLGEMLLLEDAPRVISAMIAALQQGRQKASGGGGDSGPPTAQSSTGLTSGPSPA